VIASLTAVTPSEAFASGGGWGLNGTYVATSNGDWARTNDSFHDEATVRSTWTITTECTSKPECQGRVDSDQGWSAAITSTAGNWVVKRELPDWEKCADGTSATGLQIYNFSGVNPQGFVDLDSTVFAGFDKTRGLSGACGINKALIVTLPFRLDKVS
jgi:hypothetical protein